MLTKEEAAARLDGNEYAKEGSQALWAEMKAAGLVAVFGASDDLMEFRGAVNDEVGAYDGGEAFFTREGLLSLDNKCAHHRCPYHLAEVAKAEKTATTVKALWDPGDALSWRMETTIPHAPFTIMEDDEPICIGLVFALDDVPATPEATP